MQAGRQADSARRRQRVIAAINQAGAAGTEISVSGIARAAAVDRTFLYRHRDLLEQIHALEAAPPAADSRRARRHPRVPASGPARRPRTRRPAQRARPAARKTPVRSARRAGLARIRARRAARHRRAHRQDHPGRAGKPPTCASSSPIATTNSPPPAPPTASS